MKTTIRALFSHIRREARGDAKAPQTAGDFKRTIEKVEKAPYGSTPSKKKPKKKIREREGESLPCPRRVQPLSSQCVAADDGGAPSISTAIFLEGRHPHFSTYPSISHGSTNVVTEAPLWLARCYYALNWTYEAENVMRLVKKEKTS